MDQGGYTPSTQRPVLRKFDNRPRHMEPNIVTNSRRHDLMESESSDGRSSPQRSHSSTPSNSRAASDSTRESDPPSGFLPNPFVHPPESASWDSLDRLRPKNRGQNRPKARFIPEWARREEVKIECIGIPTQWTAKDLFQRFHSYGNLVMVRVHDRRRDGTLNGFLIFRPPPSSSCDFLSRGRCYFTTPEGRQGFFRCEIPPGQKPMAQRLHDHPKDPRLQFPEIVTVPLERLDVGVMSSPDEMQVFRTIHPTSTTNVKLSTNLDDKCKLQIEFTFDERSYRVDILFSELKDIVRQQDVEDQSSLIIALDAPPLVYRRAVDVISTLSPTEKLWAENHAWYRQIKMEKQLNQLEVTELRKPGYSFDIGRWLTYRLVIPSSAALDRVNLLLHIIEAFSGKMNDRKHINVSPGHPAGIWDFARNPTDDTTSKHALSSISILEEMQAPSTELDFMLHYQLEVCLSQNVLHECNLTPYFMQKLASMEPARAIKLLEKAADNGKRIYDPMDVFKLQAQLKSKSVKIPGYCALMPAATVTPTTIYFNTPVLETSNRVIRTFSRVENGSLIADRFLRVKFTDERYNGKVRSNFNQTHNELFTHIKRTMKNGIVVGGRRYEFLAFSNSQFREHGAYFYASTPTLTVAMIRSWMGDFQHIPVVAKYASRLGQCLSTTRALSLRTSVLKIEDIHRNGFCFTDGVGMMSPFLAQMIAQEHGLPTTIDDYPSAIQFRLAGCKGVLVVNPEMRGAVVAIRPSQEKFAAAYYGLEVCRMAQFSASFLNIQIILVLSTLGVADRVFLDKMCAALADLEQAMTDEKTAVIQLNRNVDLSGMTLTLAEMITDGFMRTKEPFFISCLHLWRSWQVKYLKEKAKIPIEDGAFVLGCVDETATLRGHYHAPPSGVKDPKDHRNLPQIFIQVPIDRTVKNGKFRVITGACLLARNPSLHPGDIRVVLAVDVPALHHIKNCVVLPQTGDRDVANMCSGGDLDGDDYLVMWDSKILPEEWNHEPMDYEAPKPHLHKGEITTEDICNFAVSYYREDRLSLIAVAHRHWADALESGVKSDQCLQLAQQHSIAVDFAKTGQPAEFPPHLRKSKKPHWSGAPRHKCYHSNKIIGQLYDAVELVDFRTSWELEFDDRILRAYDLDEGMLQAAREVKTEYDEQVTRIMAQFDVRTEFEVYTTFVMRHTDTMGDYKFSETFGEVVSNMKQHIKDLCCVKAGTTVQDREWEKLGPFIAAMYTVTANAVVAALAEQQNDANTGSVEGACDFRMPFMSFPWIFFNELGHIANGRIPATNWPVAPRPLKRSGIKKMPVVDLLGDNISLAPIEVINAQEPSVQGGQLLDLYHQHPELPEASERKRQLLAAKPATTFPSSPEIPAKQTVRQMSTANSPETARETAVGTDGSDADMVEYDDEQEGTGQKSSLSRKLDMLLEL